MSTTLGRLRRSFVSFFPTTLFQTQKAGPIPTPTKRAGSLGRREHLGRPVRKLRGAISPHSGEGRGFYPSMAPQSLLLGPGWWDPHRPIPSPAAPGTAPSQQDEAGATSGTLSSRAFAPRPCRISPGRRPWGDGADCLSVSSVVDGSEWGRLLGGKEEGISGPLGKPR